MEASKTLCDAVKENNESLVLQLLQSGIDPTHNNNEALIYATGSHDRENIINLLLEYGARANHSILNEAVVRYNENVIEKLLQHGANAKELGRYNQNCLHTVSKVYRDVTSKVCEILIKYGAEVNQQSQVCRITPLWNAIDKGNNKVVEVLLQYGAQPCLEMDAPMGRGAPLEYCFSLRASTIESMIKCAALQVNASDEREVQKFFQYIANARTSDSVPVPNIGKKYAKFARDCMGEVNILKEKILNEDGVSLFDFIISQRDILESYRGNSNIIDRVFDHVASTPFPIYREVILKKLERNMIISKLEVSSRFRWCYVFEGRKSFVNVDCIELIAAYLPLTDLGNLLIAFTTLP